MAKRELTIPVDAPLTRECLGTSCAFLKRSQIDDAFFHRPDGRTARLRKQDTVTRLSCTHPDSIADAPETIVLDYRASERLLEVLGFAPVERIRFTRETWRHCQYLLHLDRTEALGDYLTVESEAGTMHPHLYRRQTLKSLKKMGICPLEPGVDSSTDLPYTAPIVPGRSKRFEPQGI